VQKEKTREALLNTAYEVFSQKGILAARMSDIAQVAGVSHGTVFLHFETQEALVTQVVEHYCGAIAARTHALSDASGTLRELLAAHLQGIMAFEPFYTRLVIENRLLPQGARDAWLAVQSAISFHFSRAAAQELGGAETDASLLFNSWIGLVHHYLSNGDLFAPEGQVIRRYGEQLIGFFLKMAAGSAKEEKRGG
jgi:AcrR family transcriptional regulator